MTSDPGQPGLLHMLAERDDADELWEIALSREDCPINSRDAHGDTPLMRVRLKIHRVTIQVESNLLLTS